MQLKIGIVGLGYLGLPLAKMLNHFDHQVIGSKASMIQPSLIKGIKVVPLKLSELPFRLPEESVSLFDVDVLVCAIPPSGSLEYVAAIDWLIQQALRHQVGKFILLSSISVYGEADRFCNEDSIVQPVTKSAQCMVDAEQSLLSSNIRETVILRLGGLFSDDRHPVKHLAAKKNIIKGRHKVNLLHQEDAVSAIYRVVIGSKTGIFNVCTDGHPERRIFYMEEAKRLNLSLPEFDPADLSEGKIVSNNKFKQAFDFQFRHSLL